MKAPIGIAFVIPGVFGHPDIAKDCKSFCDQYSGGACTRHGGYFRCRTEKPVHICQHLYWTNAKKTGICIDVGDGRCGYYPMNTPVECIANSTTTTTPQPCPTTTTTTPQPCPPTTTTTPQPCPPTTTTTPQPCPPTTTTTPQPCPTTTTTTPQPCPPTTTTTPQPCPTTTTTTPQPCPPTTTTTPQPCPTTTTTTPQPCPPTTTTTPQPCPTTTTTTPQPCPTTTTTTPEPVVDECLFDNKLYECREDRVPPICRDLYWTDSTYTHMCVDEGDRKCGYGEANEPVRCRRTAPIEPYKPLNSCDRFCNEHGNNRCATESYHIECRSDRHVCRGLYTDSANSSICIDPIDLNCGVSPINFPVKC